MTRTLQMLLTKAAIPSLALGAVLMLAGPTAAFAQRGGGGHSSGGGGHSFSPGGGRSSSGGGGRAFSGGGGRSSSAPSYSSGARSYGGGARSYGGGYRGGVRGYYGGGFYNGVVPYGWGYQSNAGCGYYNELGYWQPGPCYATPYGYGY